MTTPPKTPLLEVIAEAAARFDQRPAYRASIEARAEFAAAAAAQVAAAHRRRWCLVANIADPRSSKFRVGARVVLHSIQQAVPGDPRRYEVRGLSIGGRMITAFVGEGQLIRLRVGMGCTPMGYASKAEAADCLRALSEPTA